MKILCIIKDNTLLAKGTTIPNTRLIFQDNGVTTFSYPDIEPFILFEGSSTVTARVGKYADFIDEDGKTTKNIVFQSRNAAARFVLGDVGKTNDWVE